MADEPEKWPVAARHEYLGPISGDGKGSQHAIPEKLGTGSTSVMASPRDTRKVGNIA